MKKVIIQGLAIIILFFSFWLVLRQFDWVTLFRVEKVTNKTEEKLGELFWDIFKKTEKENNIPFVVKTVDSLVDKICFANEIDRNLIKVHILDKEDVNAFALPDGHLIIFSGLILASENQEELCGVICHEIAHIRLNHVMKKLAKEVGLSALISMTAGNVGVEIITETAKLLSSSAFDRDFEKDADIKAVDFLVKAKIDPEPFVNFLYKLSINEDELSEYFTWISTHPESKERAEYIIEYSQDKKAIYSPVIGKDTWKSLNENLKK